MGNLCPDSIARPLHRFSPWLPPPDRDERWRKHTAFHSSSIPRTFLLFLFPSKGLGPVYELKYAFLYGYNGTTFAIPGTSVGVHTGDLEHVTIRVDARRRM